MLPLMAAACAWMRGKLWIASAPEQKIVLGARPRVWLESAGPWGSETAATHIALTGAENVPGELIELLRECELTDEEMLADPKLSLDALGLAGMG